MFDSLRTTFANLIAPTPPSDPENRALTSGSLWPSFGAFSVNALTGLPALGPRAAFRIPGVSAAVQLLAQEIATLPLKVFEEEGDERREAVRHPAYNLLRWQPNSLMTAHRWRETAMIHVCLYGNSFSEIIFDAGGRPRAIWLLEPWKVDVFTDSERRELLYTYQPDDGDRMFAGANEGIRTILPENMLHIRWLTSGDGLTGESPVLRCSDAVGLTDAASAFAARFYGGGAHLSGVLSHPGQLGETGFASIKESWKETHTGPAHSHSVAILEEGMTWTPTSVSPEDGQMIPTREFQIAEVARVFGVPQFRIGGASDTNTYSNIEQETIAFYRNSLRPLLVNWEQECDLKLLGRNFFSDFDLDDVLRPDVMARFKGYDSAISAGWMTKNEARVREGLNEIDGLDDEPEPVAAIADDGAANADDPDVRSLEPLLIATIERVLQRQRKALTGADDEKAARFFETQNEVWAEALGPFFTGAAMLGIEIPDFSADEWGEHFSDSHENEFRDAAPNWNGLLWDAADLTREILNEL